MLLIFLQVLSALDILQPPHLDFFQEMYPFTDSVFYTVDFGYSYSTRIPLYGRSGFDRWPLEWKCQHNLFAAYSINFTVRNARIILPYLSMEFCLEILQSTEYCTLAFLRGFSIRGSVQEHGFHVQRESAVFVIVDVLSEHRSCCIKSGEKANHLVHIYAILTVSCH